MTDVIMTDMALAEIKARLFAERRRKDAEIERRNTVQQQALAVKAQTARKWTSDIAPTLKSVVAGVNAELRAEEYRLAIAFRGPNASKRDVGEAVVKVKGSRSRKQLKIRAMANGRAESESFEGASGKLVITGFDITDLTARTLRHVVLQYLLTIVPKAPE